MSLSDWETLERSLERMSATEKLELIERAARSLRSGPPEARSQRDALRALLAKLSELPVANPSDGFAAREHDRLLYGAR